MIQKIVTPELLTAFAACLLINHACGQSEINFREWPNGPTILYSNTHYGGNNSGTISFRLEPGTYYLSFWTAGASLANRLVGPNSSFGSYTMLFSDQNAITNAIIDATMGRVFFDGVQGCTSTNDLNLNMPGFYVALPSVFNGNNSREYTAVITCTRSDLSYYNTYDWAYSSRVLSVSPGAVYLFLAARAWQTTDPRPNSYEMDDGSTVGSLLTFTVLSQTEVTLQYHQSDSDHSLGQGMVTIPVLPSSATESCENGTVYYFTNVAPGQWSSSGAYLPYVTSYRFGALNGVLFKSVLDFPPGASNFFEISVQGVVLGQFHSGQSCSFESFTNGGVNEFTLKYLGSDYASMATGIALALDFSTNNASFDVQELSPLGPKFLAQPSDTLAVQGQETDLASLATSCASIGYQWQHERTNIPWATNNILKVQLPGTGDAGDYRVIATDNYGSVTSLVAHLSIPHNASIPPILSVNAYTPSNGFEINADLELGGIYRVQTSADMLNWSDVTNFVSGTASFVYGDAFDPTKFRAFYRIISP
jgi:hypothetical protein